MTDTGLSPAMLRKMAMLSTNVDAQYEYRAMAHRLEAETREKPVDEITHRVFRKGECADPTVVECHGWECQKANRCRKSSPAQAGGEGDGEASSADKGDALTAAMIAKSGTPGPSPTRHPVSPAQDILERIRRLKADGTLDRYHAELASELGWKFDPKTGYSVEQSAGPLPQEEWRKAVADYNDNDDPTSTMNVDLIKHGDRMAAALDAKDREISEITRNTNAGHERADLNYKRLIEAEQQSETLSAEIVEMRKTLDAAEASLAAKDKEILELNESCLNLGKEIEALRNEAISAMPTCKESLQVGQTAKHPLAAEWERANNLNLDRAIEYADAMAAKLTRLHIALIEAEAERAQEMSVRIDAEAKLERVMRERDEYENKAFEIEVENNRLRGHYKDLNAESIIEARKLLTEAGVPAAAFFDDHVRNAVVQRNQAREENLTLQSQMAALSDDVRFLLPLAKGYAADHDYLINHDIIANAERRLENLPASSSALAELDAIAKTKEGGK